MPRSPPTSKCRKEERFGRFIAFQRTAAGFTLAATRPGLSSSFVGQNEFASSRERGWFGVGILGLKWDRMDTDSPYNNSAGNLIYAGQYHGPTFRTNVTSSAACSGLVAEAYYRRKWGWDDALVQSWAGPPRSGICGLGLVRRQPQILTKVRRRSQNNKSSHFHANCTNRSHRHSSPPPLEQANIRSGTGNTSSLL